MSSSLYRNYLRLLEKWPVEVTKKGRDLGEYIRTEVAVAFRGGVEEPRDSIKCDDIYSRLNNISKDRYKEAFFVSDPCSSSGLSKEECHQIISNEFLEKMKEEDLSVKEKVMKYFQKS